MGQSDKIGLTDEKIVKRFRIQMIGYALVYTLFGAICPYIVEHPYESLWQRGLLGASMLLWVGLSFRFEWARKWIADFCYVVLALAYLHVYIMVFNYMPLLYGCGGLLMLVGEMAGFIHRDRLNYYCLFVASVLIFGMVLKPDLDTTITFAFLSFSALAACYFAVQNNIRLVNELHIAQIQLEKDHRLQIEIQQKLYNSSKLASLGEMAGGIAHEINSPLMIISGMIRRMNRDFEQGNVTAESLAKDKHIIDSTVHRIARIIRGLRLFARDSSRDPFEPAWLKSVVEDSLSLGSEKFRSHGVQLTVSEFEDCQLMCNPTQLAQVLVNLLNNSFDAVETLQEKWIRIEVSRQEEKVSVAVVDSGSGIKKEYQPKLMQPFFTTKPVGQGTGLGLSIAKGIIDVHKGKFYYDAESIRTRFVFELQTMRNSAATIGKAS